jgi:hypothetical protein
LRVVAPVPLQTVCVRHDPQGLEGGALDAHTKAWVEAVNRSGAAYLTPAVLDGRWMARVSIGALATEEADVAAVWSAMRAAAEGLPVDGRLSPTELLREARQLGLYTPAESTAILRTDRDRR